MEGSTLERICLLKRSTLALGDELGSGCPAVHVKGDTGVVSMYDVGDHVFVVVAELHSTSAELFDAAGAEDKLSGKLSSLPPLLA